MRRTEYWRFLATALPAGELGAAALRRVRRAAVRRWSDSAAAPFALEKSFGVTSLDQLAQRLRGPRAGRLPVDSDEHARARELAQALLPGHARAACVRADRVLDGELFLFGEWRAHARGELAPGFAALDWTRDPIHGGHAPDVPARELDVLAAGVDVRAVWEAGRLGGVLALAEAHVLAGLPGTEGARGGRDPALYARAAVLHVRDFLATQPVGRGVHWTCPMEAALRAIHLSFALLLLRQSPELDAPFWYEATELLWRHARFIEAELEDDGAVPGNHLLTNLAGLAVLGCLFPELPGALAWRRRALPAFAHALVQQTTGDGLSFESSLPYHRYVAELGLLVHAVARRQGLSLGPAALSRLWRVCRVAEEATLPDGRLANLGDNDASRAFAFVDRPALDTSHLSSLRAALGGPGAAGALAPEALWLGGVVGVQRAATRAAMRPVEPARRTFTASGLAILRDGDRAATLWAGENGQHGLGGHAHNDKLSVEIVLGGRRVTVDPGCPVYAKDPAQRDRFRSVAAHPTVQVDGGEQSPIPEGRPFLLPDLAKARLVDAGDGAAWGEHRGYLRLTPGVLHRREVVLPPDFEAICVTDRLLGDGAHLADVRWPLANREVLLREATGPERRLLEALEDLRCGEGRFDAARLFVLGTGAETVLLAFASESPWESALEESTWSPAYGERLLGRTVRLRLRVELPAVVTSLFVRAPRG